MKLGIDMTTDQPFELVMARLKSILDEIEEIIANQ